MKHVRILVKLVALLSLFYLMAPQWAHAYLDPGTGSYVLQLVIGAFVGILFAAKVFWKNIRSYIASSFSGAQKDEQDND